MCVIKWWLGSIVNIFTMGLFRVIMFLFRLEKRKERKRKRGREKGGISTEEETSSWRQVVYPSDRCPLCTRACDSVLFFFDEWNQGISCRSFGRNRFQPFAATHSFVGGEWNREMVIIGESIDWLFRENLNWWSAMLRCAYLKRDGSSTGWIDIYWIDLETIVG